MIPADCPDLEDLLAALDETRACPTVILGQIADRAEALGAERCAADALAARGLPPGLALAPPPTAPPAPEGGGAEGGDPGEGGEKLLRDAYGVTSLMESENFALRWGSGISTDTAAEIVEAMELIWGAELDEMGFPQPPTTDAYKLNVYIGDTGGGAPASYGFGGYYTLDPEGYPMLVLGEVSIYHPDTLKSVSAHEFFHAVQSGIGTYRYEGDAAWYYEATACWIAGEVYPDSPGYADFLPGFTLVPHEPLDQFDYPDSGAFSEYHQYGAFLFPRYLSEHVADADLIRDSWVEATSQQPLAELELLLGERGLELAPLFADFAARNAAWDYADGWLYVELHRMWEDYFGLDRIADRSWGSVDEWTDAPPDTLPRAWGANYVQLYAPDGEVVEIDFEGDPTGEDGGAGIWRAVAVSLEDDLPSYQEIPLVDGAGALTVAAADEVWIAASLTPDPGGPEPGADEGFAWRYRMVSEGPEVALAALPTPDGVEVPGGCAAAPIAPRSAGWLALALSAALAGRRRG